MVTGLGVVRILGCSRVSPVRSEVSMPIVTQVQVRQPAPGDLIAEKFVVSGIGSGFEGTVGSSPRRPETGGRQGGAQTAGGMAGVGEFSTQLRIVSPHGQAPR